MTAPTAHTLAGLLSVCLALAATGAAVVAADGGGSPAAAASAGPSVAPAPTPSPTPLPPAIPPAASYPPAPTVADLAGSRPDIVLIVLDDMPDIDDRVFKRLPEISRRFLQEGVRFTDAIVTTPLCCPSRASILTGLTANHHGVTRNLAKLFDPSETIATELQAVGYTTLIAGKYFNAMDRGFATPLGWTHTWLTSGGYWPESAWDDGVRVAGTKEIDAYSTDVMRRHAVAWIAEAPADRPIFLELTPAAPHAGTDRYGVRDNNFPFPAPRHAGDPRCAGIEPWKPPGYGMTDRTASPPPGFYGKWVPWPDGYPLWRMCESLLSVDELVGDVASALDAADRHNVLYVLIGDNGMSMGRRGWLDKFVPISVDVPLFVHWPAALDTTARTVDELVANIDLAPTVCALAGCTMGPYADGRLAADGTSLVPLLTGAASSLARVAVPVRYDQTASLVGSWVGIRTSAAFPGGRQLFVEYDDGFRERYDLTADPWQLANTVDDPAATSIVGLLDLESDALHDDE